MSGANIMASKKRKENMSGFNVIILLYILTLSKTMILIEARVNPMNNNPYFKFPFLKPKFSIFSPPNRNNPNGNEIIIK